MSLFDSPAGLEGGCRVALLVAYDGTNFVGFAEQPERRTVAGVLKEAIAKIAGAEVEVVCAGRTDAGVHAFGQVVHFDLPSPKVGPERLVRSVNKMLGPEVVVRGAWRVPKDFDARRSALWRRYRYLVNNSPLPHPLASRISWWVPGELDLPAMRTAWSALIGVYDFQAFCRRQRGEHSSTVREVLDASIEVAGDGAGRARPLRPGDGLGMIVFWIKATSFCQQMVRSLVFAMVAVGRGKLTPAEVRAILLAPPGRVVPPAPPQGLCLVGVGYGPHAPGGLAGEASLTGRAADAQLCGYCFGTGADEVGARPV